MNITNVNDFDPNLLMINEIAVFNRGSAMYEISYDKESNTPYIVFNDIEFLEKVVKINIYYFVKQKTINK